MGRGQRRACRRGTGDGWIGPVRGDRAIRTALALAFVFAAGPLAAAAPEAAQAPETEPTLVAHADGSWTITRPIDEEPPPLALATDGLLADEPDSRAVRDPREAMHEEETDREAEEAFEDSIEAMRRGEDPD